MRPSILVHAVLLTGTLACAGAPPPEPTRVRRVQKSETRPPPSDSFAVSGLHGTLSQYEIEGALKPRLPKFLRCAQARRDDLDVLAGDITIAFHIAANGAVPGASPIASTLGDRETERCLLEVAMGTRFPAPHGGEADFTWPLELPADPDVRAPVVLGAEVARSAIVGDPHDTPAGEALNAKCGGGQMIVTAYVDTSGAALAVGVSTPDLATTSELDCIASGVRSWHFDSPGSYVGKVTFSLP